MSGTQQECLYRFQLFGVLKDEVGQDFIEIRSASDQLSYQAIWELLNDQYPAIASRSSINMAVNLQVADAETVIRPGDELALIPPYSGG